MKTLVKIHSSSRYDKSPNSLSRATARYTDVADIVTYTEISDNERASVLKDITGWKFLNTNFSGWDDCGILLKEPRFKVIHHEGFKLPRGNSGGKEYVSVAQIAVVYDRDHGHTFVIAVAHFPASVEGLIRRKQKTERTVAWNLNVAATRRRVNRLKRRYRAQSAFIVADWNVDFKKFWVRAYMKTLFPNYKNSWVRPFPADGTHGDRIIDGTLFKGRAARYERTRLFFDDDSSDHRPFRDSFRWTT